MCSKTSPEIVSIRHEVGVQGRSADRSASYVRTFEVQSVFHFLNIPPALHGHSKLHILHINKYIVSRSPSTHQSTIRESLELAHECSRRRICIPATVDELCHVGSTSEDSSGTRIRGRKNPQVFHRTAAHTILKRANTIIISCVKNARTPATRLTASCSKPDHNRSSLL